MSERRGPTVDELIRWLQEVAEPTSLHGVDPEAPVRIALGPGRLGASLQVATTGGTPLSLPIDPEPIDRR